MERSPNGGVKNGANLNAAGSFFVINTLIGQAEGNFGDGTTDTANLQKLLETVQTTSIAKFVYVSSATVDFSVAGNRTAYGFGTDYNQAATTVYTVKFFVEQEKMTTAASLTSLIQGNSGIVLNPKTGVPINGPSTRTISAYELSASATINTTITALSHL